MVGAEFLLLRSSELPAMVPCVLASWQLWRPGFQLLSETSMGWFAPRTRRKIPGLRAATPWLPR